MLLSKEMDSSFYSFMGKGFIPMSPTYVFNSLRNPHLRFTYDNMLKVSLHVDMQTPIRQTDRQTGCGLWLMSIYIYMCVVCIGVCMCRLVCRCKYSMCW